MMKEHKWNGVFVWLCNIVVDVKETINNCFKHKLVFRAATQVTCDVVWMESILNQLGVNRQRAIEIFCDSISSIRLAKIQVFRTRVIHIQVHLLIILVKR